MLIHLYILHGCFHAGTTKLRHGDRDRMALRAQNTHYLPLYRKECVNFCSTEYLYPSIVNVHKSEGRCGKLNFLVLEFIEVFKAPMVGKETQVNLKIGNKKPLSQLPVTYCCSFLKQTVDENKALI